MRQEWSLSVLLAAAVLEEWFFRGILMQIVTSETGPIVGPIAAVVITSVLFSLAHIWFGWPHVLAKAPLGIGTATMAVAGGGILPAIVVHTIFNLAYYQRAAHAASGTAGRFGKQRSFIADNVDKNLRE
jgi:membrane protease YdiL (CAAX protease family)